MNKTQTKTRRPRAVIEDNPLERRSSRIYSGAPARRNTADGTRRRAPGRRAHDAYNAYDAYDAPARPPRRSASGGGVRPSDRREQGRGARPPRGRGFDGLSALLLLAIVAIVAIGVWRAGENRAIAEMKRVVSRQTFYDGTRVEGVDVSEMTLEQALEHWNTQIEPALRDTAVVLNDGTRVTAAQLGYASDYADVLAGAWSAGRTGSLVERYEHARQSEQSPAAYEVTRSYYSDATVRAYAAALAAQIDTEPSAARVKSFDVASYTFEFDGGTPGHTLDQAKLTADIEAVLLSGGGSVSLSVASVAPTVSQADIAASYGMIASAVTNASNSSSNRLNNISQSISLINGVCLEPGETFSFNQTVGERTTARGFKIATAYSGGSVTEEVGGGICQVSTTLFNAVVKANLKLVERHSHSLTVGYVDLGKDAAVDWGNKDFRFTNNTDDKIYVCCTLTGDKRIRFGIFGKLLSEGRSITLESVKTGTTPYTTEYQLNFNLASGNSKVSQKGKDGYSATTYKVLWDAAGNEIKREELCKSRYQATNEIIEYCP